MRERHAKLGAAITTRLIRRVEKMSDEEIGRLKPLEVAVLLRVSADVEIRARDVDILENAETPFEVHIHTYAPGSEPEQMKTLVQPIG